MTAIRHVEAVYGSPAPHSPYSHAVVANGFVFVSGHIPVSPGGGPMEVVGTPLQEQTRQCLRNVQAIPVKEHIPLWVGYALRSHHPGFHQSHEAGRRQLHCR